MILFKVSRSAVVGGTLATGLVAYASIALAGGVLGGLFDTQTALEQLPDASPVQATFVSTQSGTSREEMLALAEQTYIDDIAECQRRYPDDKGLCDACIQTAEAKHRFVSNRIEQDIPLPPWAFGPIPDPATSPIAAEASTCEDLLEAQLADCNGDPDCEEIAYYAYYDCMYCMDCACCRNGKDQSKGP